MLEILFPRHGAVLNHNHGQEGAEGLRIKVVGLCDASDAVLVNGVPAVKSGRQFSAEVLLPKPGENLLRAEVEGKFGRNVCEVKVLWDKQSFRRYNMFVDDHSFFWTDLARQRPAHAFDHFYLAFWKRMHEKFGVKVTLNCFFRNDHDEKKFTLEEMPDCYRPEFEQNADWLRFAFHAYSEFPDRPYQNVPGRKLAEDYEFVVKHLQRIAGEKAVHAPCVTHWAMVRPSGIEELVKHGVKALCTQYVNANTGVADEGEQKLFCDIGFFQELPEALYLQEHFLWHDFSYPITFGRTSCVCNVTPLAVIRDVIAQEVKNAEAAGAETINIISHEQYFFQHYFNYLPDHCERIEAALQVLQDNGYQPVFFNDGFLGNPAWK